MARGKYGAGRATGGDEYDLIDIGYVPTGDTGSSISNFVEPDADEGPAGPSTDDGGSGNSSSSSYSSSVPRWRRALADAISPPPPGTRRPAASTSSLSSRAGTAQRSASPARTPVRPTKEIIYGLDNRERLISTVAAALAIAFAIVVGVVGSHPPKTTKTQPINSLVLTAIFGVPAVAMLVGVAIRRRALVGFMALLTGFALFTFGVFYGILYFAFGGWLIFRAFKYNKQIALDKEASKPAASRPASSAPARTARTRTAPVRTAQTRTANPLGATELDDEEEKAPRRHWWSGLDKEVAPAPTRPRPTRREAATASKARTAAASKRYTPPRPASSQRKGTTTR